MTFTKPKNISYTDMCIYVDAKIQQDSITDDEASICYEYIYLIIYMLSVKNKYFNKEEYYDEFALSLASDVFYRLLINKKMHELDESGQVKMTKIKSCLNYIKTILYGRKVVFEQHNYSQKYLDIEQLQDNYTPVYTSFIYSSDNLNFNLNANINIYFNSITKTIKQYLYDTSPYRKQPILMKNIYISCMLSLINSLTFTYTALQGINTKYVTQEAKIRYLYKLYKINRNNCVVLYHLNDSYYRYITVLVRQLYSLIKNDIKDLCKKDVFIPEDILMNISMMEIAGKEIYDN